MPASAHKSLIACTYGGSNEVTVSKSTLRTSSAFSCNAACKLWFVRYNCLCCLCVNCVRVRGTYRVIWWAVLNFEYVHGTNHGLHCHKYVLEYQLNKATFIFIGITTAVDNSHLFDKCRFARFTSTYWKRRRNQMKNHIQECNKKSFEVQLKFRRLQDPYRIFGAKAKSIQINYIIKMNWPSHLNRSANIQPVFVFVSKSVEWNCFWFIQISK